MAESTLDRNVGRIDQATKATEKSIKRLEKAGNSLGRGLKAVGTEMFRPNDKVLDTLAKYMEVTNLLYSTMADYTQDMANILPEVADVIRTRREEQGYYSFKVVEKAFKKVARATVRKKRVRQLN
jgi:hypothetical protein